MQQRDLKNLGQQRAYTTFEIKNVKEADANGGKRTFTGIASTISTDRQDDIVVPTGAKFDLPLPLIWLHNSKEPIGWVRAARVSESRIEVDCEVHDEPTPGRLKDRLDEAWQCLKAKLVRGLSIGFNPIEYSQIEGSWGLKFLVWDWLELSPVVIAANQDASITSIKSIDTSVRAALGEQTDESRALVKQTTPGASGTSSVPHQRPSNPPKGKSVNIQQRIADALEQRTALMARAEELMNKPEDGSAMEDADRQEYNQAVKEVKALDDQLKLLREHEALTKQTAKPVETPEDRIETVDGGAAVQKNGGVIVAVKRNVAKGTPFTRYAMALAHSKGNMEAARNIAKKWRDTPEVAQIIEAAANMGGTDFTKAIELRRQFDELGLMKAASAAGTSNDATWASPLVYYENMQAEFIELLRPKTILGKMQGLRRVPFNIRVAGQTQGSTVGWVGEAAPKPVGTLAFNAVNLGHAKAAGIVVITTELARFSSPSAEAVVRQDLLDAMAAFLDSQFIDPSVLAVANVSPASVTQGSATVISTGSTLAQITADVTSLFSLFIAAELDPTQAIWVMKPSTALSLSMKRTSQDIFTFPDLNAAGGTWFGLPVITSNAVPGSVSGGSIIALVLQNEIWLADDGNVTLDVSQEASLQMVTNPSAGAQSLVSLWQNNLIGLRAEREINWQKRRPASVAYLDQVAY